VCKPVGFSLSIDPIIAEGSETASFSLKWGGVLMQTLIVGCFSNTYSKTARRERK
jgi:hypothetical protein